MSGFLHYIERRGLMTPLSRQILESYQVRKTTQQKLAFIKLLRMHFPQLTVQEGAFPKCRNIVVGDITQAKVMLTAHYDTCAQLPFPNFIVPEKPLLSIGYSLLILLPMIGLIFLLNFLLNLLTDNYWVHYWLSLIAYFGLLLLLTAGPANKHTANDNTSGVIVLCELLATLTEAERQKVCFVFFDHEESGLVGSSYFRSKYKKLMKDKLLINFDCVSDGDRILIAASKNARKTHGNLLKESFRPTESKTILFTKLEKLYYPSDQFGFKKSVAVAALKHKPFIGNYMDRIHTSKDTVFEKENIKLICDSILSLLKAPCFDSVNPLFGTDISNL